jgi:hypothetical protein
MKPYRPGQRVKFRAHYKREYPRLTAQPVGGLTVVDTEPSELRYAELVWVKDDNQCEFAFPSYWLTTANNRK